MSLIRLPAAAISLIVLASIVAGCGDSSSSPYSSNPQDTTAASNKAGSAGAAGSTVAVAGNPELGTVLVDSEGFTVYSFAKDRGTTSSCYGACAEFWPPVTTEGAPTGGKGAQSSKLGTTNRKDGTAQVTYAGHPLYTFAEDDQPGEANGNGLTNFGAVWNALDRSGSAVTASSAAGGESSAGGSAESDDEPSGRVYGY